MRLWKLPSLPSRSLLKFFLVASFFLFFFNILESVDGKRKIILLFGIVAFLFAKTSLLWKSGNALWYRVTPFYTSLFLLLITYSDFYLIHLYKLLFVKKNKPRLMDFGEEVNWFWAYVFFSYIQTFEHEWRCYRVKKKTNGSCENTNWYLWLAQKMPFLVDSRSHSGSCLQFMSHTVVHGSPPVYVGKSIYYILYVNICFHGKGSCFTGESSFFFF